MKKGFSLIELMIVIAIVGILATIGIPSYRTYIIKSYITEALSMANAQKGIIAEIYNATGSIPCCGARTSDGGGGGNGPRDIMNPVPRIELIRWFALNANQGRIEVKFSQNAPGILGATQSNASIVTLEAVLSGDSLGWKCGWHFLSPHLAPYMPSGCQNESTFGR